MSSGTLDVTLVSASISPYIPFDNEPCDTYAIVRCAKDQHCTKNAKDQGRLPVWNETFVFDLQEEDMSNELVIQVFNVRSEVDELLGLARIPIYSMLGKDEATLCALTSPTQTEIGKLKAAWKWKPGSQRSLKASSFQKQASEVENYTRREGYTAEPYNPDLAYKPVKATNYEGKEAGMQGYAESGSYVAGAAPAYAAKVPHYGGEFGMASYPHGSNPNKVSSEPYSKLDSVSDAMAKLAVDKEGSGRSSHSYREDSFKSGKEAKVHGDDHYYQPSAPYGAYHTEPLGHGGYPEIRTSDEKKGDFGAYSSPAIQARGFSDQSYSPPLPTNVYPPHNDGYPPYAGTTYPPPADAYPPNKDTYPPHSGAAYPPTPTDAFSQDKDRYSPYSGAQYPPPSSDTFPQSKQGYPPYAGATYPPLSSDAYMPSSGTYPPNKEAYPPYASPAYPPYPEHQSTSSSDVYGEGVPYTERGGGSMEKGGGKKDKHKVHGSQDPHAPPGGYQYPPAPYGYPPAPQGYPPAQHGYPPAQHGYPPAPQGYPPAPQGYPPAPHGYPPAPHGYSSAPHGYSSHGHASAPQHAAPYGYPSSGHGSHSGHHPDKHGHGSGHGGHGGAYVGHASSKPHDKHKESKHSSHKHKHDKHKKQKSFKGLKFKKFKF